MLRAYLYQSLKCFFKKKINVVFTIVGIVLTIGMLVMTGFITKEEGGSFDPLLLRGGLSLLTLAMFDLGFLSITSGILLFTNPDVNFYFAGPFTKKFNLIIPIVSSFRNAFLMVFIVSMQASNLSRLLHLRFLDAVIAMLGVFIAYSLGLLFSQVINAYVHNKKGLKKAVEFAFAGIHAVMIGAVLLQLKAQAGSFGAISSLGASEIIKIAGGNLFLKIIPVGGWMTLFFDGFYLSSTVKLILGLVLVVASFALIAILVNNLHFDYYEEAIEAAQKMADKAAAKAAGVEDISAVDASKVKVVSGELKRGNGASVFFFKHLLENKRITKLFFINKTVILYKFITFVYMMLFGKMMDLGLKGTVVMGVAMMAIFDAFIFAGGKAVLELNKPYFFLVPEKISRKLWANILGSVPEIIVNAILAVAILGYFMRSEITIPFMILLFIFVALTDVVCLFIANIIASLFNYIGKTPALFLRQGAFYGVLTVVIVAAVIVVVVTKGGLLTFMAASTVAMFVALIPVSLLASFVISRKELTA